MPFLIPIIAAGAGAGAWYWWTSDSEEEVTFESEFFKTIRPLLIILFVILLLRWLYARGTAVKTKES